MIGVIIGIIAGSRSDDYPEESGLSYLFDEKGSEEEKREISDSVLLTTATAEALTWSADKSDVKILAADLVSRFESVKKNGASAENRRGDALCTVVTMELTRPEMTDLTITPNKNQAFSAPERVFTST